MLMFAADLPVPGLPVPSGQVVCRQESEDTVEFPAQVR